MYTVLVKHERVHQSNLPRSRAGSSGTCHNRVMFNTVERARRILPMARALRCDNLQQFLIAAAMYREQIAKEDDEYRKRNRMVVRARGREYWRRRALNGGKALGSGRRKKIAPRNCAICGNVFFISDPRRKCCSVACGRRYARKRAGKDPVSLKCVHCDVVFFDKPARVKNGRLFCSRRCFYQHSRGNWSGWKNPQWRGGVHGDPRLGEKIYCDWRWRKVRRNVIKRDKGCRLCGSTKALHVHHIEPLRQAPLLAFYEYNAITLCRSCHAKILGKEERFKNRFLRMLHTETK